MLRVRLLLHRLHLPADVLRGSFIILLRALLLDLLCAPAVTCSQDLGFLAKASWVIRVRKLTSSRIVLEPHLDMAKLLVFNDTFGQMNCALNLASNDSNNVVEYRV